MKKILFVKDDSFTPKDFSNKQMTNFDDHQNITSQQDSFFSNESIFIRKRERHYRVKYADIFWIEAQSNYSIIVTSKEKYIIATTLGKVGAKLPTSTFVRVNRSFIVNRSHVDALEGNSIFINENRIMVSKNNRTNFFSHFHIL